MKVILVAAILVVCGDLSYAALSMGDSSLSALLGLNTTDPNQINAALASLLPTNSTNANDTEALNALMSSLGNGTSDDAQVC